MNDNDDLKKLFMTAYARVLLTFFAPSLARRSIHCNFAERAAKMEAAKKEIA